MTICAQVTTEHALAKDFASVFRDVGRQRVLRRDQLVGEIHVQPAFDAASSVKLAAPSGLRPEDEHLWGHVEEAGIIQEHQLTPSFQLQYGQNARRVVATQLASLCVSWWHFDLDPYFAERVDRLHTTTPIARSMGRIRPVIPLA
jgi:hypothetical protein